MIVEDIASQSSVIFGRQQDRGNRIIKVHVSLDSAETLDKRCGITNYRSIARFISNVCAKN